LNTWISSITDQLGDRWSGFFSVGILVVLFILLYYAAVADAVAVVNAASAIYWQPFVFEMCDQKIWSNYFLCFEHCGLAENSCELLSLAWCLLSACVKPAQSGNLPNGLPYRHTVYHIPFDDRWWMSNMYFKSWSEELLQFLEETTVFFLYNIATPSLETLV
jgi:hypothetical protein